MKKIGLFIQFLFTFLKNRILGKPIFASKETVESRFTTCGPCNYRMNNSCMACGCVLSLKTKFQDSNCPKNYWKK